VPSDRVVEGLDIVDDVSVCFGSGLVAMMMHLLFFRLAQKLSIGVLS
jgi:hypothetical protein